MGQTVNLLVYTFGGSNPSSPTLFVSNKVPKGRVTQQPSGCEERMKSNDDAGIAKDTKISGSSSVGRALAFQAKGRGFEPRLPLNTTPV